MDSDQGKLFIGGISWETSEEELKEYFGNYGEVLQTVVMRDKDTGRPRGFGFVVFSDPLVLDRVLQDKHVIDGRTVEAKRALSREEQQVHKTTNPNFARSSGPGANMRTKKIFVGGLPATITEEGFRQYFEEFGNVTDVVVMYDQSTQRPRGFGFISFDTEESVDMVLRKTFHDLNGKQVEVKRALPKDANPGGAGRSGGGGSSGGGGGGYPSYGSSGGIQSSYDSRGDSGRYMQAQGAGGGFAGYNTAGFGYGPGNSGMAYGGYAGYGAANAGYGGPTAAAYGNPNLANAGYAGGARSSWGTQAPLGYGAVGYGGGGVSGGPGAAPTSQSPSGAAGYGSQGGYQYGGYGGTDGSYGYAGGYGAVAGHGGNTPNAGGGDVSGSGGYMGGGYGDANGNLGYGNAYGSQGNVPQGGSYGGNQGRQQ